MRSAFKRKESAILQGGIQWVNVTVVREGEYVDFDEWIPNNELRSFAESIGASVVVRELNIIGNGLVGGVVHDESRNLGDGSGERLQTEKRRDGQSN